MSSKQPTVSDDIDSSIADWVDGFYYVWTQLKSRVNLLRIYLWASFNLIIHQFPPCKQVPIYGISRITRLVRGLSVSTLTLDTKGNDPIFLIGTLILKILNKKIKINVEIKIGIKTGVGIQIEEWLFTFLLASRLGFCCL